MQIARDSWSVWQDSSQPLAVHKHATDKLLLLHLADASQFHQREGGVSEMCMCSRAHFSYFFLFQSCEKTS